MPFQAHRCACSLYCFSKSEFEVPRTSTDLSEERKTWKTQVKKAIGKKVNQNIHTTVEIVLKTCNRDKQNLI